MSMSNEMIRRISGALNMQADERMLASGSSFEEFREFCVRSYDGAPLGEETAPESAGTIAAARSELRHYGRGRYAQLDAPTEIL